MHSFLCLGDSYTIGEGVPLSDSFPYQALQSLRKAGHSFCAPEILARTGWTTDELAAALARTQLLSHYDLITLLIGVNNQYRGRDPQEYAVQFKQLLLQAIRLTGQPSRVFVLSIPDWSVSPFGHSHLPDNKGRNRTDTTREIDVFNTLARSITLKCGSSFIDITDLSRVAMDNPALFAEDGLHPGAAQYAGWADRLTAGISAVLKTTADP
jgi:lysophospholipase L1-like esterase